MLGTAHIRMSKTVFKSHYMPMKTNLFSFVSVLVSHVPLLQSSFEPEIVIVKQTHRETLKATMDLANDTISSTQSREMLPLVVIKSRRFRGHRLFEMT